MSSKKGSPLSSDWRVRVSNEIEALSEIYFDAINIIIPNKIIQLQFNSELENIHIPIIINIQIEYNDGYPSTLPDIHIIKYEGFTTKEKECLYNKLLTIMKECSEDNVEMVHEICIHIQHEIEMKETTYSPVVKKKNDITNDKSSGETIEIKNNKGKLNAFENPRDAMLEDDIRDNDKISENYKHNNNNNNNILCESSSSGSLELNISDKNMNSEHDNESSIDDSDSVNNKDNKNNYNKAYSRFKSDFTIISKLGQGGGGSVFKVKNRWDQMYYAIKRIKLCIPKKQNLNNILSTVQSEGYVLSRIQKPYIVRYFQTWVEDYQKEDYADEQEEDEYEYCEVDENEIPNKDDTNVRRLSYEKKTESSLPKEKFVRISNSFDKNDTSSKYVNIWENDDDDDYDLSNNNNNDDDCIIFENANNDKQEQQITKKKSSFNNNINKNKKTQQRFKTLYIQMEFCEEKTLKEAIENKILSTDEKWKLITQILEAMRFIHSQKLIHRDLKPGNIFLDANFNVKLGDFGLAKITKTKSQLEELISYSTTKEILNINSNDLMTYAIGTKYYCSPEQEKSNKYDYKTDMFSLGIIIFEMFYSFGSLMERDIVLRGIKEEQKFPKDFEDRCESNVVNIVKMLTNKNPKKRPKTEELLNSSLIPIILNEQTVLDNFIKIIDENKNYSERFLDILLKKNIDNLNNNTTRNNNNKNTNTKNDNIHSSYNYISSQMNYLTYNSNIFKHSLTYLFEIYETFQYKIKTELHSIGAFYTRFSEIEIYKGNEYIIYDDTLNRVYKIILYNSPVLLINGLNDNISDYVSLAKPEIILKRTKTIFNQIGKFLLNLNQIGYKHRILNNMLPLRFYTDSLSTCEPGSMFTKNNMCTEYNEIIYCSIWNDSNLNEFVCLNKSALYNVVDCLGHVFQCLNSLKIHPNKIYIRVNSSKILDAIFSNVLGFNYKNIKQVKIETLAKISSAITKRDKVLNKSDIKKTIYKLQTHNNKNNKASLFPISLEQMNKLLENICISGSIEEIKKKYNNHNNELFKYILQIEQLFCNSIIWKGKHFPSKYIERIEIDFSYIPYDLIYSYGYFIQFCILHNNNNLIPIIECGNIDNYLSIDLDYLNFKGFAARFLLDNICNVNINDSNINERMNRIHVLLCIRDEVLIEKKELIEELYLHMKNKGISYDVLFHVQKNVNFDDLYKVFKMSCLIIVEFNKDNKEEVIYKITTKDGKEDDKKHVNQIDWKEITLTPHMKKKKNK